MTHRAVTTAIGLPPQGTIKVSQMERARRHTKAARKTGNVVKMANAGGNASKRNAKRLVQAKKVAEMPPMPCPVRAVLEAAKAGDKDAVTRAVNLYGIGWPGLAERLLGPE